jgi:hypothetical protein
MCAQHLVQAKRKAILRKLIVLENVTPVSTAGSERFLMIPQKGKFVILTRNPKQHYSINNDGGTPKITTLARG